MVDELPKVIACLPCYEAESFIERTLRSLKYQNYPNFRVFISDDGSTDNTVSIIQSSISDDDRFLLIQQNKNLGWVDNVDFLLEKAASEGTYTFIMPHDDTIEKDYIRKLVAALEENSSAVLAFSDMNLHFHFKENSEISRYTLQEGLKNRVDRVKVFMKRRQLWSTPYRGMIRTEVVKNILPSQKNIFGRKDYAADWFYLIRLAMYGEFLRVPELLYHKYYHESNTSSTFRSTHKNYFGNLATAFLMFFRSPLHWNEKLNLQLKILEYAAKRVIVMTGLYSLIKKIEKTSPFERGK